MAPCLLLPASPSCLPTLLRRFDAALRRAVSTRLFEAPFEEQEEQKGEQKEEQEELKPWERAGRGKTKPDLNYQN